METASEMCVVHNALLRGLNSIYIQGPNIKPADFKDFIGYSLCWFYVVHEHHTSEEEQFFPEIEEAVGEKGIMESNVQEHSKQDLPHFFKQISSRLFASCYYANSHKAAFLQLSKNNLILHLYK